MVKLFMFMTCLVLYGQSHPLLMMDVNFTDMNGHDLLVKRNNNQASVPQDFESTILAILFETADPKKESVEPRKHLLPFQEQSLKTRKRHWSGREMRHVAEFLQRFSCYQLRLCFIKQPLSLKCRSRYIPCVHQ